MARRSVLVMRIRESWVDESVMAKTYGSFKVAIKVIRPQNRPSHNIKTFKMPACGGFELTNYPPGSEDYSGIGSQVAVCTSIEDLALQINYYLGNEKERKKIMIDGYKRAINEHTYLHRLKDVFKNILYEERI